MTDENVQQSVAEIAESMEYQGQLGVWFASLTQPEQSALTRLCNRSGSKYLRQDPTSALATIADPELIQSVQSTATQFFHCWKKVGNVGMIF